MNEKNNKCAIQAVISIILLLGFLGVILLSFFCDIPESNKAVVYTMIGSYGTASLTCVSFWFGSTFSSSAKDELLYKSTPAPQNNYDDIKKTA